jgi:hypothetical protein
LAVGGGGGGGVVAVVAELVGAPFVAGPFVVDDSAQPCVIKAVAPAMKTANAATEKPPAAARGLGEPG